MLLKVGHGLLIHEVSYITHNDAPQSVGLIWTSDQIAAKISTWQQHSTHKKQTSMTGPDSNPQPQQASGRRPTPQTVRPLGSTNVKIYRTKMLFLIVCVSDFWSLSLRKRIGQKVSDNSVQQFGSQGKEVRSGWWKSHEKDLHVYVVQHDTQFMIDFIHNIC
jgi:hypothetical protein